MRDINAAFWQKEKQEYKDAFALHFVPMEPSWVDPPALLQSREESVWGYERDPFAYSFGAKLEDGFDMVFEHHE